MPLKSLFAAAILILLHGTPVLAQDQSALAKATFAAGCFWCTEEAFD